MSKKEGGGRTRDGEGKLFKKGSEGEPEKREKSINKKAGGEEEAKGRTRVDSF